MNDIDACLLFSDGWVGSSPSRPPRAQNMKVPIHVVLPPGVNGPTDDPAVNHHLLKWLSSQTGGVCLPLGSHLASEVIRVAMAVHVTALRKMEETDGELSETVPGTLDYKEVLGMTFGERKRGCGVLTVLRWQ